MRTWSFAAAYLDFEFDDYDGAACAAKITLETGAKLSDYSGERNIYTPLSGTLGAPAYTSYMERPRTIAVQALYRF